jgi:hypothetical protein
MGAVAVTVEIAVAPSKKVTVPVGVNPAEPTITASNCTLAPCTTLDEGVRVSETVGVSLPTVTDPFAVAER